MPAVSPKIIGSPPIFISPESGLTSPKTAFRRVDLPAPFSPSSATTSPALTDKEILSLARTPGYCLETPVISRSALITIVPSRMVVLQQQVAELFQQKLLKQ